MLSEINFDSLNLTIKNGFKYSNLQRRNFSSSTRSKNNDDSENKFYRTGYEYILNVEAENIRKESLKSPLEAGCFNYTHIKNLGQVNEFYSSDDNLNTYVTNFAKFETKVKDYVDSLPKDTDFYILPVIRKASREDSDVDYSSFSLMFPIKILPKSPMDYYKLAGILMAETIGKWSRLVNLEEGDLEFYLMGRPWLDFDDLDIKDYFDGTKCANALNILL